MKKIGMTAALAALLAFHGAAHAGSRTGNATSAKLCQKGGWQTLQTDGGGAFLSQDACVAYAAEGGALYRPLLVAVPLTVAEDQGFTLTASGFHASANATVKDEVFGGGTVELFATTDATGGREFSGVFTAGACANGITGSEYTFTDEFGLHASVVVTLTCP
jgi:hypothetical protein